MLRKDAKIELLKKVPLFSQCSKKELGSIASLTDLVDMPEGSQLVKEGALGREFMVIVEGEARVDRGGRRVNTLGSGDFFGEIALISGGPRLATVKLTKPSRLLVMTEGPFKTLLEDSPSIQVKVLQALAERLRPLAV